MSSIFKKISPKTFRPHCVDGHNTVKTNNITMVQKFKRHSTEYILQ